MLQASQLMLVATVALTLFSFVCYVVAFFSAHQARAAAPAKQRAKVLAGTDGAIDGDLADEPAQPAKGQQPKRRGIVWFGSAFVKVGLMLLTLSMLTRMFSTGHAPFANQYEFAVSFGWGILLALVLFEWKYQLRTLALVVLPVLFGILVYATQLSYEARPLMPALQNSPLLTVHVFTAALAYGAAVVGFAAAVMYLVSPKVTWRGWPKQDLLDEVGYKAVVATFPLLTIMIVLGALWANIAWGRYWSWDPKETAALVTWLVYGAYLHARVTRGWRGTRSAWLLVLGFLAILFTYFGNHFFGGLHSYV